MGMSSLPVSGYFKQLQDYYVANAQSAHISSATDSGGRHGQASGGALAADSVELSPDSIELLRPVRPPNAYCYLDTLTDSDKSLVKAATGWDIDADPFGNTASPEAKQFVGRLNLDRAAGVLKGDIDQSYISKLIQENLSPQPDQATVPLSVLYAAERCLSKHQSVSWALHHPAGGSVENSVSTSGWSHPRSAATP